MRMAAFSLSRLALVAAAGFFSAGFADLARANDVFWSVGVASPGVHIGVSNSRPVVLVPAPVYVQTAPVYRRPVPVFVQPQVVYVRPQSNGYGWHKERGHKHGNKHGHGLERGWEQQGYASAPVYPPVFAPVYGPQYGAVYVQPGYASGWR